MSATATAIDFRFCIVVAFSALTLLVGRQGEHTDCKNYLSGVRCRLLAYGLADATAPQTPPPPSSFASFKSRVVLPF